MLKPRRAVTERHQLPRLPYALDALEPHISAETLEYHYGKHHRSYVDRLNELIEGTVFADRPLEQIIRHAKGTIFNNAAQAWNHAFYWRCMKPSGGGKPAGALAAAMAARFHTFDRFKEQFEKLAIGKFGSGWAWLAKNHDGSLVIEVTDNADNPILLNQTPLLTCDVWEHAYYIDYRNDRAKYLKAFWEVVNWDFVAENFATP